MDRHLEARYNLATRFDESDLALSVRYKDAMHKLLACMDQIALLGPAAATLAEELLESAYEVTEMETMHLFQEGYRAALLDGARVPLWEDEGGRQGNNPLFYRRFLLKISAQACKIE